MGVPWGTTGKPWRGWLVVARTVSSGRTNATNIDGRTTERLRRISLCHNHVLERRDPSTPAPPPLRMTEGCFFEPSPSVTGRGQPRQRRVRAARQVRTVRSVRGGGD